MIDLYGFHTREISLPEPEVRYSEREVQSFVPSREPSVQPPTAENLAWRKRLDDACKKAGVR
jgi:hypothetical protein